MTVSPASRRPAGSRAGALPGAVATGIGSWPGLDPREAAAAVFGELPDLPHLPELPARGPGADLVGRGAGLLVDMPFDLQPSGWRLVDRPGRDVARSQSWLRQDLDELAERAEGYRGPLKLQACGPWTLAAALELPRGERVASDSGARRDVVTSLADGVARHVEHVRRLVPGAEVVLQLDEPSLTAVLLGRLPTASGYGTLRAVESSEVTAGLRTVVEAVEAAGAVSVVHCCADAPPVRELTGSGARAVSVDAARLTAAGWEAVAVAVESGVQLWAGVVPGSGEVPAVPQLLDTLRRPWERLGLPARGLADVVLTPSCGLAGRRPAAARSALAAVRRAAAELLELAEH